MRNYLIVYRYYGWTKECTLQAGNIIEALNKFICPKYAVVKSITEIENE